MDKTARMRELVEQLNEYARRYYELDDPLVSDAEYDALYDELLALEAESGRVLENSPTLRVGGNVLEGFASHRHLAPLWSMDKCRTSEELLAWEQRIKRILADYEQGTGDKLPRLEYCVEYKFDGLTVNLTYENGKLVQAATRGNGVQGEAILPQIKTIRSIPLNIGFSDRFEVQGEGIMRLSVLEKYNEKAGEPLKNARNGAAGALRNLDPKVTASRHLDAFFYQVGYIEGREFETHSEMIDFIKDNGLPHSDYFVLCKNMEEVAEQIRQIDARRDSLDYLIDGAVIKVNSYRLREVLGFTHRFPRWAMAYKFKAEEITTKLLSVTWQVGRTGRLTPVAELEPVDLAGVTVKRATLNNWEDIKRKKVKLGAEVWIRRSNDVIPEIMGTVDDGETHDDIEKIGHCPACGHELREIGPNLYCPNQLACPPQAVYRLVHFASRNAMDIETFSVKTAEQLYNRAGMTDIADLYRVTRQQLLELEGFKDKKADNLLKAIDASREPELDRFIYALGIPNVGTKTAGDLARTFGSFEALKHAGFDELSAIRDVGPIVAQGIVDFFSDEGVQNTLDRLSEMGVTPKRMSTGEADGVFKGMTVVLTGTLPSLTRSEAEKIIEQNGGKTSSSVSAKTGFVLAGENPGSKLDKARTLGIKIIDEKAFLEMIGNK